MPHHDEIPIPAPTPDKPDVSLADVVARLVVERDEAVAANRHLMALVAQKDQVIASNERAIDDLRAQLDALQISTLEETRPFDDDDYQPIAGMRLTPNQKRHLAGIPVELTAAELGMTEEELIAERAQPGK